jgi:two-component sensor histidine kinase/HAMP domain-containing protein
MKLNLKLICVLLSIAAVPLAACSFIAYKVVGDKLRAYARDNLALAAIPRQARINLELEHNRQRLGLVASRTALRRHAAAFHDNANEADRQQIKRIIDDAMAALEPDDAIVVLDLDGTVITTSDSMRSSPDTDATATFESYGIKQQTGQLNTQSGTWQLSGPLVHEGSSVGAIVLICTARSFLDAFESRDGLGTTGEALLLKPDGTDTYVCITEPRQTGLGRPEFSASTIERLQIDTGAGNLGYAQDYRNQEVVSLVYSIPETDWMLMVKSDTDEAMVDVIAMRNWLIQIAFISVAAAILLSTIFAGTITRPIGKLTKFAEGVRGGQLYGRVEMDETGEFAVLSEAFNEMTRSLETARNQLESDNVELQAQVEERLRAEAALRETVRQKDTLLRELHHRVKNNLQIISSLLNLQSANIQDESVRQIFTESRNRVRSLAMVHERLVRADDLDQIPIGDYVESLVANVFRSYGATEKVTAEFDVADICLTVDTAVPCGLIINELVSNSLKHAFNGSQAGVVTIGLHQDSDGSYVLEVGDNGSGIPRNVDFRTTESVGLQLVVALTDQLDGSITSCEVDAGTRFHIEFRPRIGAGTITT